MARSSFFAAGGNGSDLERKTKWEPRVDKDPFHRTMDIFNGVFRKHIKLSAGQTNSTDLHTIYINFGELKPAKITHILREGADPEHLVFRLECGHEWEGRRLTKDGQVKKIGDWGMCAICGTDTVYRGFEHEWQHIIFKSDLAALKIFCDQYASQLLMQIPAGSIDKSELAQFLHMLINVFDDIRVNSLWEKVYPGSAMAIWDRWRFYASRMENINTSFLCFIFAVAFNIPTNPSGEFEPMRPVIKWALEQVKYRGFNNMLIDVRVVVDRCMGALLAKLQPPPPKLQPPPPPSLALPAPSSSSPRSSGQSQGNTGNQPQEDTQGNSDEQKDDNPSQAEDNNEGNSSQNQEVEQIGSGQEGERDQKVGSGGSNVNQESQEPPNDIGQSSDGHEQLRHLGGVPSSKVIQADDYERQSALSKLMKDPESLDPKETHADPTPEDLATAERSQSLRAALSRALHSDISDIDQVEASAPSREPGEPDSEMQAQIDQLRGGVAQKTEASQLTDGAKAKVTIINVTSEGTGDAKLQLEADEKAIIQRLRAAFLRSMGKQKAKRSSVGTSVDVEALIQYLGDYQDPDVFENEDVNQGFAYSVVCDMSGSMAGCFPVVCRATEMLKQALDFPFVVGNLWGFRGGQPMMANGKQGKSNPFGSGEVWMYRYDKDVDWYTGNVPFRLFPGPNGVVQVPVECGGITPMNTAINVTTGHLWRKMSAGMAKRMFLLTDGSPLQVKVTGRHIPDFILRQFVANEISKARRHGIEVYTIVIGEHAINEDKCMQMFGPKKFWRRVGQDRVGTVLLTLVLQNFNRYLRRG